MIAYISDFNGEDNKVERVLEEIVKVAKIENKKRYITGVLFFLDGKVLQIIEGEEPHLHQLMSNIKQDKRHSNVEYLINEKVETRGFSEWNMDSFYLNSTQSFSKDTIKKLTESFIKNLLPRSDMLAFYYKTLLKQKSY